MAARFVAEWNDQRATVRNALDFAFENSKLGWIDQIVRGIDREQRRPNFFQVRTRIVIAGCFKGVKDIVRVVGFDDLLDELVERFIGLCERWRFFLAALLFGAGPDCCS